MAGQHRSILEALVAYLRRHLVKTGTFRSGEAFRALAETAVRFNESSWFWTDDNAKAAELLCEPALYDADPTTADAALDYVLRMSRGVVIQRRGGTAELRVVRDDPGDFRVETAFFIIDGDLTRGVLRHALRFNDNRTAVAAEHTGNYVAFRRFGRSITLDVEEAVTASSVTVGERQVVLSFTSAMRPPPLLGHGPGPLLGQVTYAYTVSADRPSVALTVTLAAAQGVTLRDVVVTATLDNLGRSLNGGYKAFAVRSGAGHRVVRDVPAGRSVLQAGPADYAAMFQEGGPPGFAYGMHVLLRDGARLLEIVSRTHRAGQLYTVLNRYAARAVMAGAPLVLREERMLTGGGDYEAIDHYEATLRHATGGGEDDPSMSYDIGAELNAVAVHLLMAHAGRYRTAPAPARLAALTAWYDRHVERYFTVVRPGQDGDLHRVFTRGLAFVVLSLDCMLRATADPRYRAMLETGVGLILRLASRTDPGTTLFADAWENGTPFLDCHAACLLALARAAWHGDPGGAIGMAVRGGVAAIVDYRGEVSLGHAAVAAYNGLAVLGPGPEGVHADTGFWHFKIGLVLRALHAIGRAGEAGVLALEATDRHRLAQRLARAEDLLMATVRRHDDALEIPTARDAGETNSETQPWAALGLVPVLDEQITALGRPGARQR